MLGSQLGDRLGQGDHLADDRDARLELRDLAGDDGIGGVGQVEEGAGVGDGLRGAVEVHEQVVSELRHVVAPRAQSS